MEKLEYWYGKLGFTLLNHGPMETTKDHSHHAVIFGMAWGPKR